MKTNIQNRKDTNRKQSPNNRTAVDGNGILTETDNCQYNEANSQAGGEHLDGDTDGAYAGPIRIWTFLKPKKTIHRSDEIEIVERKDRIV